MLDFHKWPSTVKAPLVFCIHIFIYYPPPPIYLHKWLYTLKKKTTTENACNYFDCLLIQRQLRNSCLNSKIAKQNKQTNTMSRFHYEWVVVVGRYMKDTSFRFHIQKILWQGHQKKGLAERLWCPPQCPPHAQELLGLNPSIGLGIFIKTIGSF